MHPQHSDTPGAGNTGTASEIRHSEPTCFNFRRHEAPAEVGAAPPGRVLTEGRPEGSRQSAAAGRRPAAPSRLRPGGAPVPPLRSQRPSRPTKEAPAPSRRQQNPPRKGENFGRSPLARAAPAPVGRRRVSRRDMLKDMLKGGGGKKEKKKVDQHKSSCPLPQVRGVERSSPRSTPPPPRWAASGVINPFVSAQPRRWLSSSGQRFTCGNITSIPQPNHMHKGKQSCIKHGIYCLLASLPNLKSPLTGPNNCTFRIKEERRGRRKKKLRARTSCGLGINSSRNVHWY